MRHWLILLVGACLAGPVAADVEESEKYDYYAVTGETPREIWGNMRALTPARGKDGKFNGYTRWTVRTNYPYERTGAGCRTGPVTVTLVIVYTLPRWDRPSGATAAVARQWDEFIRALEEHESGHADFGRQASRELERVFEAIPAQASCDELRQRVTEAGNDVLDGIRVEERAYDRRTNHGATQGTQAFRNLAQGRTTQR